MPGKSSKAPPPESKASMAFGVALGLVVVAGGGLAYKYLARPEPDEVEAAPKASASAAVEAPPRCVATPGAKDLTIGEAKKKDADAGDQEDELAPFAAQLGRAVATDNGFVVGALQEGEGGAVVSLVSLDNTGAGSVVRLTRSRGDLDPPVVAQAGDATLVAVLEPNAGGLALKLGRVTGDKVEWGSELDHPRADSLATDLAASGDRAVVVWDDIKDDSSRILMSSFAASSASKATTPRVVSPEKTDAESPRLIAKKDGFYLLYIARGAELEHAEEDYPELKQKAEDKAKAQAQGKDKKDDEVDESRGERVFSSWVEVLSLDANGAPSGSPVKLTKETGHITGYDVAAAADGFALVWRDEDSPSGGAGGSVRIVHVTGAGPQPIENITDESRGDTPGGPRMFAEGIPTLLDGWVSVPEATGRTMIGRISSEGHPTEAISEEPSLGSGDPIAARSEVLLLAEPVGGAVRLRLVTCGAKSP
jgi:hypothetical protein